jgi:hypothetical protein
MGTMIEKGARLRMADRLARNGAVARYVFMEDCPFLLEDLCTIYKDPTRPKNCATMRAGSTACTEVREARGVPLPLAAELPVISAVPL